MKNNPRYGATQNTLKFDNFQAPVVLTDEEKASYFISRYNETVDPFVKYKRYWDSTAIDFEIILSQVKNGYKRYVASGKWTETKYTTVVNEIFDRDMSFTQFTFDKISKLYDSGEIGGRSRRRRTPERSRRRRG